MTHHWDEFSKSLAEESLPRRESLRRLGFLFAGAVLSPLGIPSAWAGGRDPCRSFCRCRNKSQQNACLAACNACNGDTSRLCGYCGTHACTDFAVDFNNCGACGNRCPYPGPYEYGACINGNCEYTCVEGAVYCDEFCTFLGENPDNCGACGNICPGSAPWCIQGECTCPASWGLTACEDSCVNLLHNPFNCGACGNVCGPDTPDCVNGVCLDFCAPGLTFCLSGSGGYCADLLWDDYNCGACHAACQGFCSGGECYLPPLPDESWGLVFE